MSIVLANFNQGELHVAAQNVNRNFAGRSDADINMLKLAFLRIAWNSPTLMEFPSDVKIVRPLFGQYRDGKTRYLLQTMPTVSFAFSVSAFGQTLEIERISDTF